MIVAAVVGVAAGCSGSAHRSALTSPPAVAPTVTTAAPTTEASTTTAPATTSTILAPAATSPTGAVHSAATATTAPPPTPATTVPCPSTLAGELRSTGTSRQLITVVAAGWGTTVAQVQLWQKSGPCWVSAGGPWTGFIGENGFSEHHIEGDGTTPVGFYGVGREMYGNQPNPGVREPYQQLDCGDWWDEDPNSPGYNTFQDLQCGQTPPFGGGSEALWKETAPYPSFAVVDYNTGPIVKGAGSAIFFHADTGTPTSGCVSVPLADLDQALRWIDPAQAPAFVMGPAQVITSL